MTPRPASCSASRPTTIDAREMVPVEDLGTGDDRPAGGNGCGCGESHGRAPRRPGRCSGPVAATAPLGAFSGLWRGGKIGRTGRQNVASGGEPGPRVDQQSCKG